MEFNILEGKIPSEIGGLSSIGKSILRVCEAVRRWPTRESLFGCSLLLAVVELYLDTNRLSGSIPSEVGRLASLGECHYVDPSISSRVVYDAVGLAQLGVLGFALTSFVQNTFGCWTTG